jgi:CDP-diglyceride synthetase
MTDEQHRKGDEGAGAFDPTTEAIRFLDDDDATGEQPPLRFASDDLPHWSNPPTGEMPRVSPEDPTQDLQAWSSFATAPVWREDSAPDEFDHIADLTSEVPLRISTQDRRAEEFFAEPEPEPLTGKVTSISSRQRTTPPGTGTRRPDHELPVAPMGGGPRNIPVAIGVGVALAAVALALFKAGPKYTMILVVVALVAAVVEFYDALRRAKYQPATLLGIAATAAMPLAAYHEGTSGMVLVGVLAVIGSLAWFVLVDPDNRSTSNVAVTVLGVAWVGGLGSFAALIVAIPPTVNLTHKVAHPGIGVLLAVVCATVAQDVFALAGGSVIGRSPLAPKISPNKTVEGLICGMTAAVVVPVLLSNWLEPWKNHWTNAAYLGLAVAVLDATRIINCFRLLKFQPLS